MSGTLSEIEKLIEEEVCARVQARMKLIAGKLMAMAHDIDEVWHNGGHVPQMTDGIEIVPPTAQDDQPAIAIDTAAEVSADAKRFTDAMLGAVEAVDDAQAKTALIRKAPLSELEVAALTEAIESDASVRILESGGGDAGNRVPAAAVDAKPDWHAAATKAAKSPKLRQILDQLATDGDITLNGVIYAFRPPIKEAYALNFVSDVRRCLKAAGWDLVRGNDGAYRAQVAQ